VPTTPSALQTTLGWLILAVSTVVFLAIATYFVYVFFMSSPGLDIATVPGGGSSLMRQAVQQLHQ
jgi:hypothetical protein